jgi:hypothetical protein
MRKMPKRTKKMKTKINFVIELDFEHFVQRWGDHLPTKDFNELMAFVKQNHKYIGGAMKPAFYNTLAHMLYPMKKDPESTAVLALKNCSAQTRKEILFELKGVTS